MLDAKPEPIAIDPAHTAVIVVDMENDFAAKGGMFDRAANRGGYIATLIEDSAQGIKSGTFKRAGGGSWSDPPGKRTR